MGKQERLRYIRDIQKTRQSKLITYITSDRPNFVVLIGSDTPRLFYDHLISLGNKIPKLDLFLYSAGGDTSVPWRIISLHANHLSNLERIILVLALFSIAIAVSLFVMPVIYHHLQFPYTDVDKFKKRAHRFILFGLVPTAVTLYLGMILAFSPLLGNLAYFVAGLPFVFVYILYRMRK